MPIGTPIRGAEIQLINSEIHISGDCLALRYVNQPDLTDEKLAYQTGDLAHEENGLLIYDGRIDEQLKIRGFRVEPAEIEKAILSHTGVQQAKVFGQDQMLMAYYVSTSQLDDLFLKDYLRQKLPSHLIPHRLECVAEIPMTLSGKIAQILDSADFYDLCGDSLKMLELINELSATHTMSTEDIEAIIRAPTLRTINRIGLS